MESGFFTWGNLLTWAICSVFIYLALNFRLYMVFHHPGRKLKAKARAARAARLRAEGRREPPEHKAPPAWGERDCFNNSCFSRTEGMDGRMGGKEPPRIDNRETFH
jgi:hypothetical protein